MQPLALVCAVQITPKQASNEGRSVHHTSSHHLNAKLFYVAPLLNPVTLLLQVRIALAQRSHLPSKTSLQSKQHRKQHRISRHHPSSTSLRRISCSAWMRNWRSNAKQVMAMRRTNRMRPQALGVCPSRRHAARCGSSPKLRGSETQFKHMNIY